MTTTLVQSIRLRNFKRFDNFYLSARSGNILVGPNNSGKSSILDALRVAQACLRFTRSNALRPFEVPEVGMVLGHQLPEQSLPIPVANVTKNYSSEDAVIEIRCANGNTLVIRLNSDGRIIFYAAEADRLRSANSFRKAFPIELIIVPPLGPFEETEHAVTPETVRRNEGSRLSNRYFRHIWRGRSQDEFMELRNLLSSTWPGMEIKPPEMIPAGPGGRAFFQMFYNEERIDREIYWAGFGFQVWLQMLTHMLRGSQTSILVLDEPDIYLHPDLQRRLLRVARERFGQIFLATHSVEIINEAEPGDVISVNSAARTARRVQTDEEYQALFKYLGSVENIDFSRLGRARRLIFFEGNDKKILRKFASKLGAHNFVDDLDTIVLQSGGFGQWKRVKEVAWTFKEVLKIDVEIFALFDRDYRSQEEVDRFLLEMNQQGISCHVLGRKEIENYCLTPENIRRAIKMRQEERLTESNRMTDRQIARLVSAVSDQFRHDTSGQLVGHRIKYSHEQRSKMDPGSVSKEASVAFERRWKNLDDRFSMLAGKDFIAQLSDRLQKLKGFSLTANMLIDTLPKEEVAPDLASIISKLDQFCKMESSAKR